MPTADAAAPHVVVVGGGISGLAAAFRASRELPAARVTLLEASSRPGGSLHLAEVGGVRVDVGAEAILQRRPEGVALAREVGLGGDVVHPAATSAHLWTRGHLVPMPRSLMGVPGDLRTVEGVLSARGIARAALDAVLPATDIDDRDISVGHLVEERLGKEVVDRLVEPLLGGVYAGHSRELSARAAVPQLVALLGRDRSLTRAAAAALRPADTGAEPVFAGISGGVARLAEALASSDGVQVRTHVTVRELARRPGNRWQLVVGSTHDPELVQADAVVLATPSTPTARLVGDVAPGAASELSRVECASMAVLTFAFAAGDFPELSGSGFLVPPIEGRTIKAATFSASKWDWVRAAGAGVVLMRCSIGRHREEHVLQVDDDELVQIALADLRDALGLSAQPLDTHVQRWGGALPQYAVGHLDRVAAIRREIASLPGLAVCGSTYDGVGIPACIASADLAVAKIVDDLARMGP